MRKPTSYQILEFIRKNQTATVRDLSLALGVTRANITYHLRRLKQQSKIELVPPRHKAVRGRAEQRFQLATGTRANNYQTLTETLLGLIEQTGGLGEDAFATIGRSLAENISLPPGLPTQRLNRLCGYLNRHGYQASWIAGRQGPQIILKNCPYAELVNKKPGLCRMDCALFSNSLSLNFEQVERINFSAGLVGVCRFSVVS